MIPSFLPFPIWILSYPVPTVTSDHPPLADEIEKTRAKSVETTDELEHVFMVTIWF